MRSNRLSAVILLATLVSPSLAAQANPLAGFDGYVEQSLRLWRVPGVAIAQAYSGRPLAVTVGVASAASVVALIVLEFLALGRLTRISRARSTDARITGS